MERASQSELLWAYAITRDEYAKRLSEKSLLKAEDLEFIRDRIFELINRGEAKIHDSKEKQQLQAVVEKYLYPTNYVQYSGTFALSLCADKPWYFRIFSI